MKQNTENQNQKSGLLIRPEHSSAKQHTKTVLPKTSFKRRYTNRALNTESLLALLRSEAPRFFDVAEVVGKWVWIQFADKQPSRVTRSLSELGFHWNNSRQSWQHPCGTRTDDRATYDPRKRYGSYFAADVLRA
jgi:hypothetical protein